MPAACALHNPADNKKSLIKDDTQLVCWWWQSGNSCVRLIAPVVTTTSIILSSNNIQIGDTLILAYPGCPGKWPLHECHCHVDLFMSSLQTQ